MGGERDRPAGFRDAGRNGLLIAHSGGRPGPVTLVGCYESALADKVTPLVTVVAQDAAEVGDVAAQLLSTTVSGDTPPPRGFAFLVSLIGHHSGEITPIVG
jgi:LacI family transcriptional regulator